MPQGPSVLIVEENEHHRSLIEERFRSQFPRAEIRDAGSLHEASRMLPTKNWDLIVMSWEISDGKGSEFLDEVSEKLPFTAVAILTEKPVEDSGDDLPDARHQGAVEFLTKDRRTLDSFMMRMNRLLKNSRRIRPNLPFRDPQTHVYTRAYCEEALYREVSRADRYRQEFSILIVDIDHLRKINLQNGSPAGDRCLKKLASIITRSVRSGDVVGRYGPDEFIVLLSQCQRSDGIGCASRILEAIKTRRPSAEDGRFTVSIGVLHYQGTRRVLRPEEVLLRAERTLRRAKSQGGNRYQAAA